MRGRDPRRSQRYDRESEYRANMALIREICEVHGHAALIIIYGLFSTMMHPRRFSIRFVAGRARVLPQVNRPPNEITSGVNYCNLGARRRRRESMAIPVGSRHSDVETMEFPVGSAFLF
ncbi:hypothetical protein EVAR_5629_1 [Eumeta japonica]|uniref:Uncharacterized protein n=1 Tax=Eumeta variegata TaxID=151549 RepID=A0A4C1TA04_EUMVA|nr:hypothetical protein EVAR_5629_1 [Eumeta japonica]